MREVKLFLDLDYIEREQRIKYKLFRKNIKLPKFDLAQILRFGHKKVVVYGIQFKPNKKNDFEYNYCVINNHVAKFVPESKLKAYTYNHKKGERK